MLLLCALTLTGCFGDWVRARERPRREEPRGEGPAAAPEPAAPEPATPEPADPCAAYLAEVSALCTATLDGRPGGPSCHGELVHVTEIFRVGPGPGYHAGRPGETRPQRCARHRRSLVGAKPRPAAEPRALGPACRRWAEALRERCVAPLSSPAPQLGTCAAEMATFISVLEAITYSKPEAYEAKCREAVRGSGAAAG